MFAAGEAGQSDLAGSGSAVLQTAAALQWSSAAAALAPFFCRSAGLGAAVRHSQDRCRVCSPAPQQITWIHTTHSTLTTSKHVLYSLIDLFRWVAFYNNIQYKSLVLILHIYVCRYSTGPKGLWYPSALISKVSCQK